MKVNDNILVKRFIGGDKMSFNKLTPSKPRSLKSIKHVIPFCNKSSAAFRIPWVLISNSVSLYEWYKVIGFALKPLKSL